jgi:MoaA/NifB/PqqE/SkfB family radical SAM enzyme
MYKETSKTKYLAYFFKNELTFFEYVAQECFRKCPIMPQHVYIETTNACNMACTMCSRRDMKREVRTMTVPQFKRIIDNMQTLSMYPRLTLTGSGEPFSDSQLINKIRYVAERGYHVSVITNGTLLKEEIAKELLDSGIRRIQISFDSIHKKKYDAIRVPRSAAKKSYFCETLQNVKKLLFLRRKLDKGHIYLSISSVQMDLNKNEENEARRFWLGLGVDNVYFPQVMTRSGKGGISLKEKSRRKAPIRCVIPFKIMNIMSNGDVPICGPTKDDYVVGNVFRQPIEKIWASAKMNRMRKAIFNGDFAMLESSSIYCRRCDCWKSGNSFSEYRKSNLKGIEKQIEYLTWGL